MARPTVPHCKECKHLEDKNENYWPTALRNAYGCWFCKKVNKYINGQEIRTSPGWCPLRARGKTSAE